MARRPSLAGIGLTLLLAWLVLYPILIAAAQAADRAAIAAFVQRPGEWRGGLGRPLVSGARAGGAPPPGGAPPLPFSRVGVPGGGGGGGPVGPAPGGPPPP